MTSTGADVLPAVFATVDVADPPPVVGSGSVPVLWSRRLVWSNVAGNALAVAVLAAGWYGLSGSAPRDHGRWLAWAVGGLVIAGLSNAALLLTGRFRIARRVAAVGRYEVRPRSVVGRSRFVTAPGLTHYHQPDCQLVAGRPAERFDPAERGSGRAGLEPCRICEP